MKLSTNELFSREVISETSKLLNIDEEVVSSVISLVILQILKDCSKQSDYSNYITIKIPRIADINISKVNKTMTIDSVYLYSKFKDNLRTSITTDKDLLFESITSQVSKLIINKFEKIINDDELMEEGD